jgi:NhaP-type Na+/H+ or K+/H+ antiporter
VRASAGVFVGLLTSLVVKWNGFRINNESDLESILVILFAFSSYLIADGLGLSGIVAVLFCGMVRETWKWQCVHHPREMRPRQSVQFVEVRHTTSEVSACVE